MVLCIPYKTKYLNYIIIIMHGMLMLAAGHTREFA